MNVSLGGRMLVKRRSKVTARGLSLKLKLARGGTAGNLTRRRGERVIAIMAGDCLKNHAKLYDIHFDQTDIHSEPRRRRVAAASRKHLKTSVSRVPRSLGALAPLTWGNVDPAYASAG